MPTPYFIPEDLPLTHLLRVCVCVCVHNQNCGEELVVAHLPAAKEIWRIFFSRAFLPGANFE